MSTRHDMKNFKKYLIKCKELFIKALQRFPLTIISVFLLTLMLTIFIYEDYDILNYIYAFLIMFTLSSLLTESLKIKSSYKNLGYIISFILALTYSIYQNFTTIFLDKVFESTIIILFLLTLYFNYKYSKKSITDYLLQIFNSILKIMVTYLCLAFGSLLITVAIGYLLLNEDFDLILRIEILIFGIYLVPNLIYSLVNDSKIEKFTFDLLNKVLLPLSLISYLVVFAYIVKIIIELEIPSNEVFTVCSIIFLITTPISLMIKDNKTKLGKINDKLFIILIPVIILQIISLYLRVNSYGFTIPRYIGVYVIILELTYIIFKFRKFDIGELLIIICFMVIFGNNVPFINKDDFSLYSQYLIFKDSIENKLDTGYGAYLYLKSNNGEKYLDKVEYTKDDLERLKGTLEYEEELKNIYLFKSDSELLNNFNISEYNLIKWFDISKNNLTEEDINNLTINGIAFDLRGYLNRNNDDAKEYIIGLNENDLLVLKKFSCSINELDNIVYLYMEGYILSK